MKDFYTEKDLKKMGFKSVGTDIRVSTKAIIRFPELTTIGSHVAIDPFVYISVRIDIGNYVHIAPFVGISGSSKSYCKLEDFTTISEGSKLICGSDDFKETLIGPTVPLKYRKVTLGTIILKKFSNIATNVIIFPNVTLNEGTTVGANSLVTKDLEPWWIYYGTPVKKVKERSREQIERYQKLLEEENI